MSIRQDITRKVCEALEAITPANGYVHNFNGRVYEWRSDAFIETELPAIIVRDIANDPSPDDYTIGSNPWALTIELVVVAIPSVTTGITMREMIEEIEGVLITKGKSNWNLAAVSRTTQPSDEMTLSQDELTVTGARILFGIIYSTT